METWPTWRDYFCRQRLTHAADIVFIVFLVVAFASIDVYLSPFVRIFDPTDDTLGYPISVEQVPTYLLVVRGALFNPSFLVKEGQVAPGMND